MIAGNAKVVMVGVVAAGAVFSATAVFSQTPTVPRTQSASHIRSLGISEKEQASNDRLAELAAQARRSPDDAEALAAYGLALVRSGQHDEGLNALMRASVKAPHEPRILLLYSKGLIQAGHMEAAVDKALQTAKSPLATKEQRGEAYSVAGFARYKQGKIVEAEAHLRKAVKATPGNSGALLNLGLVLYGTGRGAVGVTLMEKAARQAPEDPRIQRIIAHLYDNMGRSRKSLEAWERVSVSDPEDIEVHLKVAMGWISLGEAGKAIGHLERCVQLNPGVQRAHVLFASALVHEGEYDKAREQAEIARGLGANITRLMELIEKEQAAGEGNPSLP